MEVVFGIAALEIVFFWVLSHVIGLNAGWFLITVIVVVAAIATLRIESVIRAEVRKLKNPPPDEQDADETE